MRVLETLVAHTFAALRILDGTTGTNGTASTMSAVDRILDVRFCSIPRGLAVVNKPGILVFSFARDIQVFDGVPDDEDLSPGQRSQIQIEGSVEDPEGHFNPTLFRTALAPADPKHGAFPVQELVLYRTPAGARVGKGGSLYGRLQLANGAPASFSLITLTVRVAPARSQIYRAEADRNGEFVLPLRRLPPLTGSIANYPASVRIEAGAALTGARFCDAIRRATAQFGTPPAEEQELSLKPGEQQRFVHPQDSQDRHVVVRAPAVDRPS